MEDSKVAPVQREDDDLEEFVVEKGSKMDRRFKCIDWSSHPEMKKMLESEEYWSKDWDAQKTQATDADVEFVKKYKPVPKE